MLSFLFLFSPVVFSDTSDFVTPFNSVLGTNNGVIAYSNGNCDYVSHEYYDLDIVRAGLKWQCVEYARRWLILTRSLTYDKAVPWASDIWHLNSLESLEYYPFTYPVPLNRVPNGSRCPPVVGSILIYSRGEPDIRYGHVAIITGVDADYVEVAEENWDNDYWPGNYARRIEMKYSGGNYTLHDELPILGWMVYRDYDRSCFDAKCSTCSQKNTDPNVHCVYS